MCFYCFSNYLSNHTLWDLCLNPKDIVPWHLTLFSMLLIMGLVQVVLCAFQAINGLIGTICGDCCGCCGVRWSSYAIKIPPPHPPTIAVTIEIDSVSLLEQNIKTLINDYVGVCLSRRFGDISSVTLTLLIINY